MIRNKIDAFVKSEKQFPILTIVLAGLYPLLYYYDKNYAMTNSWSQFVYLVLLYFVLPITVYFLVTGVLKKVKPNHKFIKYVLPVFNAICFLSFIVVSVYGFQKKKLAVAILIGCVIGVLLYKHLKKILILQALMIFMVLPKLVPDLYREVVHTKQWMEQPDAIEKVSFIKTPNVYFIQPDGYVNFSTFKNPLYNYDNSKFENFLNDKGFTAYPNFRSNYFSTLSSNSSLLAMKHHYYGNKDLGINPRHNSRNAIVEENPVINTFKHNKYKTLLMLQVPYLLSNRPDVAFDYSNITLDEVPYMSRGFSKQRDLLEDTKTAILEHRAEKNFFFIESMKPSHITTLPNPETDASIERLKYLERIEDANEWLTELITFITDNDPKAIIIIAADHGGYVGFEYFLESHEKTVDELKINSMFSSVLAIKWPDNKAPAYDTKLKTSVNLFRVLFTYLSNEMTYLNNLENDKSYVLIRNGVENAVYEYIDEAGAPILKVLK